MKGLLERLPLPILQRIYLTILAIVSVFSIGTIYNSIFGSADIIEVVISICLVISIPIVRIWITWLLLGRLPKPLIC